MSDNNSSKTETQRENPTLIDSRINKAGQIVGLIVSTGFFIFAVYFLVSGKLGKTTDREAQVFYLLVILLGGIIPYFFASSNTYVSIRSKEGAAWIGGGYAVAVVAVLLVSHLIPREHIWRSISLDNQSVEIRCSEITVNCIGEGRCFQVKNGDDLLPFVFICDFSPGVQSMELTICVIHPLRPMDKQQLSLTLTREGPTFETIRVFNNAKI